jgi:Phospholipase_D-nuclease N-terminal
MVLLSEGLPVLIELGLALFCLIDCIQSSDDAVRNLPKWAWIVLILLFPFVGAIAWLVAGRPFRDPGNGRPTGYPEYARAARRPSRPVAPDDDPDFLWELGRVNTEHEQTLKQWEADLARREQELRRREEDPPAR